MGLIGELAGRGIAATVGALDLAYRLYDRYYTAPAPRAMDEELSWDGCDDLWPEDTIVATDSEPELILTPQWGLRLPSGHVAWGNWAGVNFEHPLDRVLLVAKLQKTGLDLGFAEDQLEGLLCRYGWATRNQIASVVYEDTGTCALTDPRVSAPDDMGKNDNGSENAPGPAVPDDPAEGVCDGPVGSDAP